MNLLIQSNGMGYAIVNLDSTTAEMIKSGLWSGVTLSDFQKYRNLLDSYSYQLYFIRADGRYGIASDDKHAYWLRKYEFYQVEQEDYTLFANRHGLSFKRCHYLTKDQPEVQHAVDH